LALLFAVYLLRQTTGYLEIEYSKLALRYLAATMLSAWARWL